MNRIVPSPLRSIFPRFLLAVLWGGAVLLIGAAAAQDDKKPPLPPLPEVFSKPAPTSVGDLKAIQDQVDKVVEKVLPCTVSVRIGNSSGSGVIVSKDGYVLTAGHVSGTPNRDVTIYFHDGKTAKGKTLGGNHGIDSGMIKITTPGDWPFLDMGKSEELKVGHWCIVCGHPGGFKTGRPPVVRVGRVLKVSDTTLVTDCVLVGGDSGGPLFDMHGRVIGINSRIGQSVAANMHVPVNPYRDNWERLAKGEVWGGKLGVPQSKTGPWLGVQTLLKDEGCVVVNVAAGSPADKAGLKAMDIILTFAGKDVKTAGALSTLVQQRKVGDEVALEILRGDAKMTLKLILAKRS